jgi:hypothetical protein
MPTISQTELESKLRAIKGTTIVTVTTFTTKSMNKKVNGEINPYHGRVQTRARNNCMIGFIYTNSVNNQREREGNDEEFVAHPRKWGVRVQGTPLVEHKGNVYLECKVQKNLSTQYFVDGEEVDRSVVEPWFTKRKDSGRQEVENPVILMDPMLSNIEQIAMFGETYTVIHAEEVSLV